MDERDSDHGGRSSHTNLGKKTRSGCGGGSSGKRLLTVLVHGYCSCRLVGFKLSGTQNMIAASGDKRICACPRQRLWCRGRRCLYQERYQKHRHLVRYFAINVDYVVRHLSEMLTSATLQPQFSRYKLWEQMLTSSLATTNLRHALQTWY